MSEIIIFVGRECNKHIKPFFELGNVLIPSLCRRESDEPCGAGATILKRLDELCMPRGIGESAPNALLLEDVICKTDESICLEGYLERLARAYEKVVMLEAVDFPTHRIGKLNATIYREEQTQC